MINPATILASPLELLFVSTDMALSKLIKWGFDEPASHLAIDIPGADQVVHSDLLGLHRAARKEFLDQHKVIGTFKIWLDIGVMQKAQAAFLGLADAEKGSGYDFGAFSYLGWRAFCTKFFGSSLPPRNPWGDSHKYLCTEAAYLLNQVVAQSTGHILFAYDTDLGAMTPWQLRTKLIRTAGGKNEVDLRSSPYRAIGVRSAQELTSTDQPTGHPG